MTSPHGESLRESKAFILLQYTLSFYPQETTLFLDTHVVVRSADVRPYIVRCDDDKISLINGCYVTSFVTSGIRSQPLASWARDIVR